VSDHVTIGFGDAEAGLHGIARAGTGAVLLGDGDLRTAVTPPAIERLDSGWRVAAGDLFTVELEPLGDPAEFADGTSSWQCRAIGSPQIDCLGGCTISPQPDRASTVRTVTAWFGAELGFVVRALRPAGVDDHERETLEAFVLRGAPLLATAILDPRLTTTYDEADAQYRAGLELWEAEDSPFPLRLAGERVRDREFGLGERLLRSAFFAWHHDGQLGAGRYDVELPL
jgi:hypothetical protein